MSARDFENLVRAPMLTRKGKVTIVIYTICVLVILVMATKKAVDHLNTKAGFYGACVEVNDPYRSKVIDGTCFRRSEDGWVEINIPK